MPLGVVAKKVCVVIVAEFNDRRGSGLCPWASIVTKVDGRRPNEQSSGILFSYIFLNHWTYQAISNQRQELALGLLRISSV
jgi:hypothetical protein